MHLERAYCVWSILWLYSAPSPSIDNNVYIVLKLYFFDMKVVSVVLWPSIKRM